MILVAIVLVFDVALVVVFGRRRSTLVAVPVVAAYGWRRCHSILETVATTRGRRRRRRRCRPADRRRPADLLLVAVGPDQVVVSVEILPVVVVGRRCFHCRSRQSF